MGDFVSTLCDGSSISLTNPDFTNVEPQTFMLQLSRLNRWAGGTVFNYSVLHHSILVAEEVPDPAYRIYGFLHDFHEAITGDITGPMKALLISLGAPIEDIENRIQKAILDNLGLPEPSDKVAEWVHDADMAMRDTEWRDCVTGASGDYSERQALKATIKEIPHAQLMLQAEDMFQLHMECFHDGQMRGAAE